MLVSDTSCLTDGSRLEVKNYTLVHIATLHALEGGDFYNFLFDEDALMKVCIGVGVGGGGKRY